MSRRKHVENRHNQVMDPTENKEINLVKSPTENMDANLLTKWLGPAIFEAEVR